MKKYLPILAIALFFGLTQPCYANPVPYSPFSEIGYLYFILLGLSPIVEAAIAYAMLRSEMSAKQKSHRIYLPIFAINVATVIATQVLAYKLFIWFDNKTYVYLAEILPLVAEYVLLAWLFAWLYKRGVLIKSLSRRRVLVITLVANIVTFGAGIGVGSLWGS